MAEAKTDNKFLNNCFFCLTSSISISEYGVPYGTSILCESVVNPQYGSADSASYILLNIGLFCPVLNMSERPNEDMEKENWNLEISYQSLRNVEV